MAFKRKKDKWERPELIVLVRGRLEESVLVTCKGDGVTDGPPAQVTQSPCIDDDPYWPEYCYDHTVS